MNFLSEKIGGGGSLLQYSWSCRFILVWSQISWGVHGINFHGVPGLDGMGWNVPYLFYFIRSYQKSYQYQCKLIYKMVYWRSVITKLERSWGGNPFPQKRKNSLQVIDVQLEGGNPFPQKTQNSLQVIDVQLVWHLTACKVMKLIVTDKILLLAINNNLLTNMLNCP